MGCNGSMYCENCGGVCSVDQGKPSDQERAETEEAERQEMAREADAYSAWAERMLDALDGH